MSGRVQIVRDFRKTHVLVRDGMGGFAPILDDSGQPIDLSDYDGRAGERPQFRKVSEAQDHFERVQDLFEGMA
ncbi:hypothetical protein [Mesorhizobium sp.]|uniref:hypothetical protein n=1 Tax=Mesorhizobium sp. TaxID=1871066 RepID=UPI0012218F32|nr:hypothetical protein [Mesorhizobium sp.]TIL36205.1 MAG: hypothetical protein E5Y85_00835 [Mesorhizobium sp.]